MTTTRPYLIRAFYEWIADNSCTPHIVVNAYFDEVSVPLQFVEAGQIVLNVSTTAAQNLSMTNDAIQFEARFSGVRHSIFVPIGAIMAIYARENGRGMVFSEDDEENPTPTPPSVLKGSTKDKPKDKNEPKPFSRAHLTIVK